MVAGVLAEAAVAAAGEAAAAAAAAVAATEAAAAATDAAETTAAPRSASRTTCPTLRSSKTSVICKFSLRLAILVMDTVVMGSDAVAVDMAMVVYPIAQDQSQCIRSSNMYSSGSAPTTATARTAPADGEGTGLDA